MELLLRIIIRNISTEYFSGIFQEKTLKKIVESGQLCTLAPCHLVTIAHDLGLGDYMIYLD